MTVERKGCYEEGSKWPKAEQPSDKRAAVYARALWMSSSRFVKFCQSDPRISAVRAAFGRPANSAACRVASRGLLIFLTVPPSISGLGRSQRLDGVRPAAGCGSPPDVLVSRVAVARPDVGEGVVSEQLAIGARALGYAIHQPFSQFENSGAAEEVMFLGIR